jgi:hypothetical protein
VLTTAQKIEITREREVYIAMHSKEKYDTKANWLLNKGLDKQTLTI